MTRLDPERLTGHLDRLYRAAWALCGSREDAEDLVQETCMRVLARPRAITGESELPYLMGALRNAYHTARRTASRRPPTAAMLEGSEPADPRRFGDPEQALEASAVFDAIAALTEPFRLAITAVDVLGLSYREAAQALSVPEATITTRVYRARQQVIRTLEGHPVQGTTLLVEAS